MASTAFNTNIYIQEAIAGFEAKQSKLRATVHTVANINGTNAVFLVSDSGGASATTRGANGLIPARSDNLTQYTATLQEWHDLVTKTKFSIDFGQADQRKIMQQTGYNVMNRKIDYDIITQLDAATTQYSTTANKASLSMVGDSLQLLGENNVDLADEDNIFGVITPAFNNQLMQIKEFANANYVDTKPMMGSGVYRMKRWFGVNWVLSTLLTGGGTATEKCYLYHRDSIGHAIDTATMDAKLGYNEEQAYSYARTSANMGSKLLQQDGIVQMLHTGTIS